MSLSESNKCCLKMNVEAHRAEAEMLGPAKYIEDILVDTDDPDFVRETCDRSGASSLVDMEKFLLHMRSENQNIKDNRKEAEQYIAGLLGMI